MQASRDENYVPTLLATLETDGKSVIPVIAEPNFHALELSEGVSGTDNGNIANRDGNYVPVFMAVSSVDGVTPVVVYADQDGRILVKNT